MRRSILITVVLLSAVTVTGLAGVTHFWRGTTLSKSEVAKRWGKAPLDITKFKNASRDERAKMTYSLLDRHKEFLKEM